jgi:hypothetical protein
MRLEKFFDPFAVFRKLILQSKKHFNQAQGEHAFGVSGRFAATELGGISNRWYDRGARVQWVLAILPQSKLPQSKLVQDEVLDSFGPDQMKPYRAVLPVPTDLEPEERAALPFQFDPFDQLAGANLRRVHLKRIAIRELALFLDRAAERLD